MAAGSRDGIAPSCLSNNGRCSLTLRIFMADFLQKLLWFVTGSPRLILNRTHGNFLLSAFRGRTPADIRRMLRKWPSLAPLANLPVQSLNVIRVPVAQLCNARLVLQRVADLPIRIDVAPEVSHLQPVPPPDDFAIDYEWTAEGLIRRFNVPSDYAEDGWFITDSQFWQLPILPEENQWLQPATVAGSNIVVLLRTILPLWRQRKLPIRCSLCYLAEPAFRVRVGDVTEEAVQIAVEWCNDPKEIYGAPSLSDHVLVGDTLRPGIPPRALDLLGESQKPNITLKGEAIPIFIRDKLPKIKQWTSGAVDELSKRHHMPQEPGALVLKIEREEFEGVGSVVAIPEFVCGGVHVNAEQLSFNLNDARQFLRIGSFWSSVAALKAAGIGSFGRATDGSPLSRITLRPAEVLARSSWRLNGPWKQGSFPQMHYPQSGDDWNAHLAFLLHWGIPGGIAGELGSIHNVFRDYITTLKAAHANVRILVIGGRKMLDQVRLEWGALVSTCLYGLKNEAESHDNAYGVVLVTPKALEYVARIQKVQWNLMLLLEADSLIKTANSRLFQEVCNCNALLTVGSFASSAFLAKNSHRAALTQAFKLPVGRESDMVWKYGLLDSAHGHQRLSDSVSVSTHPRQGPAAEYVLGEDPRLGSPIPIRPPHPQSTHNNELTKLGLQIRVSFSTGEDIFVENARKLVNQESTTAQFVPFESYRPTYDSMSVEQKRWYFYWRARIRAGQYPETTLSYIFVHIYELINGVGLRDLEDGYRQLRAVWQNYRKQYSKLDFYLADWISDYILVNGCPLDPIQPYLDLLAWESSPSQPDLVFARHHDNGAGPPPLPLLSCYSAYSLSQSKFYNQNTGPILAEKIPQAFAYANKAGIGPEKKTLMEAFRPRSTQTISRYPFQGAVYAGPRKEVTVGTVYPYFRHEPFRTLMTSVFKYSENKLRQALQYKFLLRGMNLPSDVQVSLDRYFSQQRVSISQPLRIEINAERVQALKVESDQVREMLLQSSGRQEEESTGVSVLRAVRTEAHIPRPPGTPDHLLTDLDEVFRVLARLGKPELELIKMMMQANWEVNDTELRNAAGNLSLENAIEHINQIALQHLGDLLIATETGRRIVAEDFRDEIEHLLKCYTERLHPPTGSDKDSLPREWVELKSRLGDIQRRALRVVSAAENVHHELEVIAREIGSMPEMLVDGINELAMETIGDIIIDSAVDPPVVEEEDRQFVDKILALG